MEEGIIVGENQDKKGSVLWTTQKYTDFDLELEYMTPSKDYDSGVFARGASHQVQIGVSRSLKIDLTACIYAPKDKAGSYPAKSDKVAAVHKLGEWNKLRIIVRGKQIQTYLNDEAFVDYEGKTIAKEGPIGLQLHAGVHMKMLFKNIQMKDLSASADWKPLWNGKNFKGFQFYFGKNNAENKGTYSIKDGIMACSGRPSGYIMTKKSYSKYTIKYDYAFKTPKNLPEGRRFRGNSGCLIHVGEANVLIGWPRCVEVQGQYQREGLILPIPRNLKCERTFDQKTCDKVRNPLGKWNTMEIDVNRSDMVIKLNGTVVSTVKNCELTSGPIAFQSEGVPTYWKNIRILEK